MFHNFSGKISITDKKNTPLRKYAPRNIFRTDSWIRVRAIQKAWMKRVKRPKKAKLKFVRCSLALICFFHLKICNRIQNFLVNPKRTYVTRLAARCFHDGDSLCITEWNSAIIIVSWTAWVTHKSVRCVR